MHRSHPDKEAVARLIDAWLQRSGLRQLAVAQRAGLTPDEFYQGYKNLARQLNTDAEVAIAIVKVFAEQPAPVRATAAEAIQFLILTHLPLDRFVEVAGEFPEAEWQQAFAAHLPGQAPARPASGGPAVANAPDAPYLLISISTDPDNTWAPIYLTEQSTRIGRLEAHESGPGYVNLERPEVSRQHALITRERGDYMLKNWNGRAGIGLYEKLLVPGDTHQLRHCDIFRIPDLAEHYRVMFVMNDKETRVLPFRIEQHTQHVYVFGRAIRLTPLEYKLICYLHQRQRTICGYEEIIAHLWPYAPRFGIDRRKNLDTLLSDLRKRISEASNGFTFMQTIRGTGITLVV